MLRATGAMLGECTSLTACPGWLPPEGEELSESETRRGATRATRFRSFSSRASVSRWSFLLALRTRLRIEREALHTPDQIAPTHQHRLRQSLESPATSATRPPAARPLDHAATPDAVLHCCPEHYPSRRATRISCRPACPPSTSDSTSACYLLHKLHGVLALIYTHTLPVRRI